MLRKLMTCMWTPTASRCA